MDVTCKIKFQVGSTEVWSESSDLMWAEHITRISAKVRKLTRLLYRRFHHCDPQTMLRLYKSIIRPHLEYAPHPHLHKDINLLEKSQKFALRVCIRNWSASYEDLLNTTHVSSLSDRRKAAKLCHLYKLVYNLIDCQNVPVVVRDPIYSRRRNPIQLQAPTHHSFTLLTLSGISYPFSMTHY